ncbi:MAG: hypothetical protein GEU73_07900 [Chloroflexi bacterium]|nr:hypothetical protein [Chloroflexota bacterium]
MLNRSVHDRVLFLTVDTAATLGDASTRLAWQLLDICADIEEQDELPVCVVLGSGGTRFWLEQPRSAADCDAVGSVWARATHAIARASPPTLALIRGDAIGPAWELALSCDLRIAAVDARVGSPEVRWGRMPAAGGTQRLARVARIGPALRLLMLGEVVPAPVALELGLLHCVAAAPELETQLARVLESLRSSAPIALAFAKEALHRSADLPLEDGLRLEADLATVLQTTRDRQEGVQAFLERRPPRFSGR